MAQPAQAPNTNMDPNASETIPPLTNDAPAIFVPIRDDILNSEPPQNRIERLKRILETIDYQREGVKENLMCMYEREKKRIMLEAAKLEQAQGPPRIRPGVPPSELEQIIANMETPAEPGKNYNLQTYPPAAEPANLSLRDRTVVDILRVVERGLSDLESFEGFMADIKNHYLGLLERETARIEEAGKRPEERSGFRSF
ncbi:hypothetical protein N657DRAFT_648618 [Parathielavia appendiculata]|uniref:Uncharacterized protein n=1 Tax=Parathielavia appendiculata TaxID=2587402 RepID=A0AAN6TUP9_9PEZI|nr:hypothetical protein N657DRAFT_648618 [Parathielavia appendiculata]